MEINNYRLEIIDGKHINSYVELKDGDHYKVSMVNSHSDRCHASLTIDGKHMGTWVLGAYQKVCIERPVNVDKVLLHRSEADNPSPSPRTPPARTRPHGNPAPPQPKQTGTPPTTTNHKRDQPNH